MLSRIDLGLRMQAWHGSQWDPIYMVGSLYFAGQVYPDKEIVSDAVDSLTESLLDFKRMLAGEKVRRYNSHYGKWIEDQREFAGYSDQDLTENISDITEILESLQHFLTQDY